MLTACLRMRTTSPALLTSSASCTRARTHQHAPALRQYSSSFEEEQVTGKRLMRVSEDVLKKKLNVTSLGHRKEIMRHLDALLRARKAYLKL